jgi:uncharacterized protein
MRRCFIFSDFARIWTISALVSDAPGFRGVRQRVKVLYQAALSSGLIGPLLHANVGTPLQRLLQERPETFGVVGWPYLCASWSRRERIEKIVEHCNIVGERLPALEFSISEFLPLLDLSEIVEGLHVVVDQPRWFMREGLLVINLFNRTTRIYSLAFTLERDGSDISAIIGAVQGRDIDGILDQYRDITKGAHGLRPRDLLIEIFRMFCIEIGVKGIRAVSDRSRHHRSAYFHAGEKQFSTNYDDIWEDRGGTRISPDFYEIKVVQERRVLEDIPSKKRGMYRKRYEMMNGIKNILHTNLLAAVPRACAGEID